MGAKENIKEAAIQVVRIAVPAQPLEAARLCMGQKDVRYYLNGVRINQSNISGTNGHVMYDYCLPDKLDIKKDYIIAIPRAVPTKADIAEIEIGEKTAIIRYSQQGKPGRIDTVEADIIDGKYPDTEKILKTAYEKPKPVEVIAFNAGYLALCEKIAKRVCKEWMGAKMYFHGDSSSLAHFEFNGADGKHVFIAMPMRI